MSSRDPHPFARLRTAVPTIRHAEMLFDLATDELGDDAFVETADGGRCGTLYRCDAGWNQLVHPWPILRVTPGSLEIGVGTETAGVRFDEQGEAFESQGSPAAFEAVNAALAPGKASPLELLAAHVLRLDPARIGPGRLFCSVPFPQGAGALWHEGRRHLRDALWVDRVPRDARWAVADTLSGDALAWGATRDAALGAWCDAIDRRLPWIPKAEAPDRGLTEEEAAIEGIPISRGPEPDAPMPARAPEFIPAAVVPLAAPPAGQWRRLLSDGGAPAFAVQRADPGGFTLFGDAVVAEIHRARLDARLRQADDAWERDLGDLLEIGDLPPWPEDLPPLSCRIRCYRLLDETTGRRVTSELVLEARLVAFDPGLIDGGRLRFGAMRVEWEG